MGLADDARRINNERETAKQQQRDAARARERQVVAELHSIIDPLAHEFAAAAKRGRWFGPKEWVFGITYNADTSGDGYNAAGSARVTISRSGGCVISASSAGYGSGTVHESIVRSCITRELAKILDG